MILVAIFFSTNIFSQENFKFTLSNKEKSRFFLYDIYCNSKENKCRGKTVTINKWKIKGMNCYWNLVSEGISAKYINYDTNKVILNINHGTRSTMIEFSYRKHVVGNTVTVSKAAFIYESGKDERVQVRGRFIDMTGCTDFSIWN